PLTVKPFRDAGVAQELDRPLLEHARADPVLDIVACPILEDNGLDPRELEQARECEPRGPGADDPDLRPQRNPQNGNGCVPLCTVIQRSSVNSSITAWPPKRPQPESFTPPNGICGSSPTGWSLTWTMPDSSRCASAKPRSGSLVMMPAARPYAVAFARSTASSALPTTSTASTGPNVSSCASSESAGTSASTVAWKQGPTASPPASTRAPFATASSTRRFTVASASGLISGPMIVSGSAGLPAFRPAAFAARRLVNSSAIERSTITLRADMQICP